MWLLNAANVNASPSFDSMEGSMVTSTDTAHPDILAIETLILDRCKVLGLSRADLVRRSGYRNLAKGLRRLDELYAGDMRTTASLIVGLPAALDLPPEIIDESIRETVQQIEEAARIAEEKRESAWRASFRPCAYLLGAESRPSQITIYGITGGPERWLKIPLDLSRPAVTFAAQALVVVRRTPTVPFFGATIGFIVNFTPDFAVRFDTSGNPVEAFDRAYQPGLVSISIGGKEISGEVFGKITGLVPEAGCLVIRYGLKKTKA
jgi:hypothetical protein